MYISALPGAAAPLGEDQRSHSSPELRAIASGGISFSLPLAYLYLLRFLFYQSPPPLLLYPGLLLILIARTFILSPRTLPFERLQTARFSGSSSFLLLPLFSCLMPLSSFFPSPFFCFVFYSLPLCSQPFLTLRGAANSFLGNEISAGTWKLCQ
jgi:hypothetical protein